MKNIRFRFLLPAIVVVGLLSVAFYTFIQEEAPPTFGPKPSAEYKKNLKALTAIVQGKLVFERSGKRNDRLPDLYLMQLGDKTPKLLAKEGNRPRWSPDGKRVLFIRNDDVMVIDEDGKNETRVATSSLGDAAAWFPDGRQIAFTDIHYVRAVDLATGEVRELAKNDSFHQLEVSPEGQHFVATLKRGGGFTVRLFDLNTDQVEVLAKGCSPSFSPDGKYVTNNRFRHVELHIREALTGKHVATVNAPEGYRFDNQAWSNHQDWMTSVIEGPVNQIFIHHVWDDKKTQVTALGDCGNPDLFVE